MTSEQRWLTGPSLASCSGIFEFTGYVQRSLIAAQGVMGDRAALVYDSVPRLSQLYSAWMPAADVLQDRFPCFVRPYSYGFLLAGYPAELLPSPDPSAQSAVSLVDLDVRTRKDRLFPPFEQPQEKDSPVSSCRALAYACRFVQQEGFTTPSTKDKSRNINRQI